MFAVPGSVVLGSVVPDIVDVLGTTNSHSYYAVVDGAVAAVKISNFAGKRPPVMVGMCPPV